jgi:hypothetical protein
MGEMVHMSASFGACVAQGLDPSIPEDGQLDAQTQLAVRFSILTHCPLSDTCVAPQHTASELVGVRTRLSTCAGNILMAPGSWTTAPPRCIVPYGGNDRAVQPVTAW